MKPAHQYPVTFGYLAKTTINGQSYTHRGTDRACPVGTPIVVGSTTIGLTGNTGLTTGPHLHLQAGTDVACQNTVNPEPYAFKAGKVVTLRTVNEKQWGKFITLQVGSMYITYAHLSQVNVAIGQVIKAAPAAGGGNMIPDQDVWHARFNKLTQQIRGRDLPRDEFRRNFVGNESFRMVESLSDDAEADRALNWQTVGRNAVNEDWSGTIRNLQIQLAEVREALANEQAKPPREVVKEVEKIVEVPVEVKIGEEEAVRGFFGRLLDLVFKK
jgi:hypothetical protein